MVSDIPERMEDMRDRWQLGWSVQHNNHDLQYSDNNSVTSYSTYVCTYIMAAIENKGGRDMTDIRGERIK